MPQNKTSSRSSSGNIFPALLLGALGIGFAYYLYDKSGSDMFGGSSSGGMFGSSSSWLDGAMEGGAATNSDRVNPVRAAAGAGAGLASVPAGRESSGSDMFGGSSSGGSSSSYVAEVGKKAALVDAGYSQISKDQVDYYNSQLKQIYTSDSAFNFAKIPDNAAAYAVVNNTGISNAGKELLSIVNADGSYQMYDWQGQIVSSGSAGAFSGSSRSSSSGGSSSSGSSRSSGGSSGGSVSSKKVLNVSGSSSSGGSSSKETVPITADKASVIRSSGSSSSGSSRSKKGWASAWQH